MARKPLITAMEDGEFVDVPAADQNEAAAAASTELLELTEQEGENTGEVAAVEAFSLSIEDAVENVEEAEAMAEAVGDVAGIDTETMEPAEGASADGLAPEAAAIAEEAFSNIYKRLGIQKSSVLPSMESFRSANSRRSATRIGLEGIVEQAKLVWQKILEAIRQLWAKVVAFYKRITDSNVKMEKAAKAQKERLKGIKAKIASKDDFEDSTLTSMFPQSGKLTAGDVKKKVEAHVSMIGNSTNGEVAVKKIADLVSASGMKDGASGDKFQAEANDIISKTVAFMTGVASQKVDMKSDEQEFKSSNELVDGKVVEVKAVFNVPNEKDQSPEYRLSYAFVDGDRKDDSNKKVEVATISELTSVCDEVEKLAKSNSKFSAEMNKAKAETDKVIKAIEKIVEEVGKAENGEETLKGARKGYNLARKVVAQTTNKIALFGTDLANRNVRCGRGALRFVNNCASQYSGS